MSEETWKKDRRTLLALLRKSVATQWGELEGREREMLRPETGGR
jgi:hypothetical protein